MKNLGGVLRRACNYRESEEISNQAISLAQKYNYDDAIAFIHYEMSCLARDLKKWEETRTHCKATIDWFEKYKDKADLDISVLIGVTGVLGFVEFHLGNYQYGKELVERALAFYDHFGKKSNTTKWHWRLAEIEKELSNREKALQHAQEAHFWAERLGMVRELEGAKALLRELNAENPSTQGTE